MGQISAGKCWICKGSHIMNPPALLWYVNFASNAVQTNGETPETGILQNSMFSTNINSQNAVIYCQTSRFLYLPLWYSTFPGRIFGPSHHLSLLFLPTVSFICFPCLTLGARVQATTEQCRSSLSLQHHNCMNRLGVMPRHKSRDLGELPCEPSSVGTSSEDVKG